MEALPCSRSAINVWIRQGCPHNKAPNGRLSFDLDAVRAWRVKTGKLGRGSGQRNVADGVPAESMGDPRGRPLDEQLDEERRTREERGSLEDLDPFELVGAKRRADLRKAELEVEKRERIEATARGELLPVAEVERRWLERVQLVGAGLLSLATRLAPRLAGKGARAIERELEAAARELLAQYAEEWPE